MERGARNSSVAALDTTWSGGRPASPVPPRRATAAALPSSLLPVVFPNAGGNHRGKLRPAYLGRRPRLRRRPANRPTARPRGAPWQSPPAQPPAQPCPRTPLRCWARQSVDTAIESGRPTLTSLAAPAPWRQLVLACLAGCGKAPKAKAWKSGLNTNWTRATRPVGPHPRRTLFWRGTPTRCRHWARGRGEPLGGPPA